MGYKGKKNQIYIYMLKYDFQTEIIPELILTQKIFSQQFSPFYCKSPIYSVVFFMKLNKIILKRDF